MKKLYEIDYMLDPNIDERIKSVCQQAENNYILNFSKNLNNNQNSISPNQNYSNNKIDENENEDKNNSLDKTLTKSNSDENLNILDNFQKNNIIDYNSRIKNSQQLLLSHEDNNNYNNNYINNYNNSNKDPSLNINKKLSLTQNNISNINTQIKNNNINYNSKNNENRNKNDIYLNVNQNNNFNSYRNNNSNQSQKINNYNPGSKRSNLSKEVVNSINKNIMFKSNNIINPKVSNIENNNNEDIVNYNSQIISQSHIHHNNTNNSNSFLSSTPSFCFECDLHKLITEKDIYNKNLNMKAKINKEINNIILSGKIFLQKNKLEKAYTILSGALKRGVQHPDLFYLYGEVCRKLKYMEDAEKYLLLCLNYKNCSPYVYLSLAQFYEETGQMKYSKNFYKKCLLYFNNDPSMYYNLGINYMKINKPLKALNYLSEAINLDPNQPLYYKYRSEVYKSLGHKDLYQKDINSFNKLSNRK